MRNFLILASVVVGWGLAPTCYAESAKGGDRMTGDEVQVRALQREVGDIRRELAVARQKGGDSDVEIATRVLAVESMLRKQREIAVLLHAWQGRLGNTERLEFQQQLAAAKSAEERDAIRDRYTALRRVLIRE